MSVGSVTLPGLSQEELRRSLVDLEARVTLLEKSLMVVSHNPPDRPRDGMMRIADGTDWDPGSGFGLYLYNGGTATWTKL